MAIALTEAPVGVDGRSTKRAADRRLFLIAVVVISAIVVAGFAKTYFFRALFPAQEALTVLVWAHGLLMSGWIGLFITQIVLVAMGHTDWHRRLGQLGVALLALIALASVPTVLVAARLGGDHMPGPALPALAEVLGFLFTFLGLATVGLLLRRYPDTHKRLMLVATLVATEAATSRLPLDFLDSTWRIHAANDVVLLGLLAYDTLKHRRLHPAFLFGALTVVVMQAGAMWAERTAAWLRIARSIVGVG